MRTKLQRKAVRESTVHIHVRNDHFLMPIIPSEGFESVPSEVPFSLLNSEHARKIHRNSLITIRNRGGMTIHELYCNLTKKFPAEGQFKNINQSLVLFALDLRKAVTELS